VNTRVAMVLDRPLDIAVMHTDRGLHQGVGDRLDGRTVGSLPIACVHNK
jgi:hypothetical protein